MRRDNDLAEIGEAVFAAQNDARIPATHRYTVKASPPKSASTVSGENEVRRNRRGRESAENGPCPDRRGLVHVENGVCTDRRGSVQRENVVADFGENIFAAKSSARMFAGPRVSHREGSGSPSAGRENCMQRATAPTVTREGGGPVPIFFLDPTEWRIPASTRLLTPAPPGAIVGA